MVAVAVCLLEALGTGELEDSCTFPSILLILKVSCADPQVSSWEIRVVLYFN